MREDIAQGVRDTWAAAIGLIPLGLAFGLLMVQSGFSWWWTPCLLYTSDAADE